MSKVTFKWGSAVSHTSICGPPVPIKYHTVDPASSVCHVPVGVSASYRVLPEFKSGAGGTLAEDVCGTEIIGAEEAYTWDGTGVT